MRFLHKTWSLLLALCMVFGAVTGTVTYAAAEEGNPNSGIFASISAGTSGVTADIATPGIVANLKDLEKIDVPAKRALEKAALSGKLKELDTSGIGVTAVSGLPWDKMIIPEGAKPLISSSSALRRSIAQSPEIGDTKRFYNYMCTEEPALDEYFDAEITAVGSRCIVYVEKNSSQFEAFKTDADAIAEKFDNEIAQIAYGIAGEPIALPDTFGKVNIVLCEINVYDPDSSMYTGGFFHPWDFFETEIDYPSNEDTNIYIDITKEVGYKSYKNNPIQFYSFIAHELQHLINFSQYYLNEVNGIISCELNDPEYPFPAVWLNEGLAGLVETIYLNSEGYSMDKDFLGDFLKNDFASGVGYVPTSFEWHDADDKVFANYGAACLLMLDFYYAEKDTLALVESPETGYANSKKNVGEYYWESPGGEFDAFFTAAMLDVAVSTPLSTVDDIKNTGEYDPCYLGTIDNLWQYRSEHDIPVKSLEASAVFDTDNRRHYSDIFLADAVGAENDIAIINIPENTEASYFVIAPFNAAHIDERAEWDDAGKIAAKLRSGENRVIVGTNNMFAVLAVAYETPVNESISYAVSKSGLPVDPSTTGAGTITLDLNGERTGTIAIGLGLKAEGSTAASRADIVAVNNNIIDLSKSTVTAQNDTVTITAKAVGSTGVNVYFYDEDGNEMEAYRTTFTVNVIRTYGRSSGSGGGSSGSSQPAIIRSGNVNTDGTVNGGSIMSEAEKTLKSADKAAILRVRNGTRISAADLKKLAEAAGKAGKNLVLYADTIAAGSSITQGRLYIEPHMLTGLTHDLKLGIYTDASITAAKKAFFERWYKNKAAIVSCDQQFTFGARLKIAAKVDLTGMDTQNLYFYSYDRTLNFYRRIDNPEYKIDANGYLHFFTAHAGDIVICEGALVRNAK